MDTLRIFRLNRETLKLPQIAYLKIDIPYKIIGKFRLVISPFGNKLLVVGHLAHTKAQSNTKTTKD